MDPNPPPPKDKKGSAPEDKFCGNCLAPQGSVAKLSACARCGLVAYCSKDCQRAHWKANHKKFCIAKADRAPPPQAVAPDKFGEAATVALKESAARAAAAGEECAICLDPLTEASAFTLPCGHVFHAACVTEVRNFGVKQVCPMCRTELPPGPGKVHEEALRRYIMIHQRMQRGEASWGSLTKTEQHEMNEVVAMWREAAEQGCAEAQTLLAEVFAFGECVKQDYSEAAKWYRKAADQGYAEAQFQLGSSYMLGNGVRRDPTEVSKWYRKAADQGYSAAQFNLGLLYAKGVGVQKSRSKAIELYTLAASQGCDNAKKMLAELLSSEPLLGSRVKMQGLKAKPEMNGAKGVVQSFNDATGRYEVQLDSGGQPFMLKAENLQRL